MGDPVALRSIQTVDEKRQAEIVKLCESILEDAKAGRFEEIFVVASFEKGDPEGDSFAVHHSGGAGIVHTLGFLEMVKHSHMARARGG